MRGDARETKSMASLALICWVLLMLFVAFFMSLLRFVGLLLLSLFDLRCKGITTYYRGLWKRRWMRLL